MLEPPWGLETPDYALRVACRAFQTARATREYGLQRVWASVVASSVGCSLGCFVRQATPPIQSTFHEWNPGQDAVRRTRRIHGS
jgi:hypothetical protein